MVTIPISWFWVLLTWLIASDTGLREWISSTKKAAGPKGKTSTGVSRFSTHARIVAYSAMAGLLWSQSQSPQSPDDGSQIPSKVNEQVFAFRQQPEPKVSFSSNHSLLESQQPEPPPQEVSEEGYLEAIGNETLGFQKIFVVNLPERADKRDAMSLVSALTGIKLTWTSAVRGSAVPDKALPLGVDRKGWRDGGIGSWRSQMNVIRTMVEENIASALILEDDADWDVRLKDQLSYISSGTRTLLDMAHKEEAFASKLTGKNKELDNINSPYGDGWDIMWLGHCGETFPERIPGHHEIHDLSSTRYTYYAMEDDETLPTDPSHVTESWIAGDLERHKGTRWVHFSGGPTCSAAYALSQSGARKVLLALSVGGTLIEQLDNAMSHLCRDHTPWDSPDDTDGPPGYPGANMRCLSVNPAVFSQHKPRGRKAAESDIEAVEDAEGFREEGESPNLVWSARLNVQNLMMGKPMQDQVVVMQKQGD